MTLQAIYGDWRLYNDLVIEALHTMSTEELALRDDRGCAGSRRSMTGPSNSPKIS